MKKIAILGFGALMMVSLTGCSDAVADISNGKETLISVGSETITNADIYEPLFLNYGYAAVNEMVNNAIFDKEVPLNEELEKNAKDALAKAKESSGDAFTSGLTAQGYKDEDDFYQRSILPSVRYKELAKKFLNENAEEQLKVYKPVKVRIIATTSEENATKALDAVNAGTSFEDAAKEFGKTDTYNGSEVIVNNASGLPTDIWSKISVISDKEAMINEVIKDSTNAESPVFYVVKVTNTSALDEFKEDALTSILEKSTSIQEDTMVFYLKKYDFRVYDIDTYNLYKTKAASYLVQDAE